ncbi:MAG: hypothetical protein ACO1OB_20370 [Archangium sp.]
MTEKVSVPTQVRVGVMDSARPGEVVTLQVRHLSLGERMRIGSWRFLWVGFVALFISNFILLVIPAPHIHLCSLPIALALGPLVGYLSWRIKARFDAQSMRCPKCSKDIEVPAQLGGWPARFNCIHCGRMVELSLALERPAS